MQHHHLFRYRANLSVLGNLGQEVRREIHRYSSFLKQRYGYGFDSNDSMLYAVSDIERGSTYPKLNQNAITEIPLLRI
jgi:hypothetical protein